MEPTMPHDAVIIGGSYAGLSAAIQLVRARRRVLIIDDGKPRNRFAARAHGVLAQDGRPGTEILAAARAQVAAYPTAAFRHEEAVDIGAVECGFEITLADGTRTSGRRLLLAHGVTDRLPDLPGVHERWGRTVLHCPYCHGYEIGGGPIGVLGASNLSIHQALLIADWGQVTLFMNDVVQPNDEERRQLARRGVIVEPTPVSGLEGDAPSLTGARLSDGRLVPLKAMFLGVGVRQTGTLVETLGCALDDTPMGRIIRVDDFKQTTVSGIYAAGDVARMASSITLASADGVMAGIGVHRSLIEEEMA